MYWKKNATKVYLMKSRLDDLSLTEALVLGSKQMKPQEKGFQYIQFMTVGKNNNHIKTAMLKTYPATGHHPPV